MRADQIEFKGSRRGLAAILLRGYALMVVTLGFYRFWLVTQKRRYYWAHTHIDGDALEYTGNAVQLLVGFLLAVAIFVPLWGLFFYLSTQGSEATLLGYAGAGVVLWFLTGYAIFRARDFRLSRTLWRGIRFDLEGNAWGYAFRRFFWSILLVVTLGLIYPLMAADLWRYRYNNTWWGDQRFLMRGRARNLAGPYFACYAIVAVFVLGMIGVLEGVLSNRAQMSDEALGELVFAGGGCLLFLWLVVGIYRAIEISRMASSISIGNIRLRLKLHWGDLLILQIQFAVALALAYAVLAFGGYVVLGTVAPAAFADGFDPARLAVALQNSYLVLLAIVFGYLLVLATFTLCVDLFLAMGFWMLIASSLRVGGAAHMSSVKARPEDGALAGEGLADALNVGAY
ncbi:membrane protein [Devosia pacifica]|uniref:Membrane protein n=1 Tax=Devosia pacifica TaxID=1335967 RepID=A0A918S9G5_9HYPH|nr:DUF898 family protein [Devosia pacifica]GHA30125.1 membrane protein [Devosia pacifica]